MVTCNKKEDYDILFALRSHGWLGGTRHYKRSLKSYNQYAKQNPQLDPRYIFINSGFNLRPTDIQAAIAHNQFNRLEYLKKFRNMNRNLLIKKITKSKKWNNQFEFIDYLVILIQVGWDYQFYYLKSLKIKKKDLLII